MSGTSAEPSQVVPAGHLELGEVLWPYSPSPLHAALGPARVEQVPPDVMWAALGTVDPHWSLLRLRRRPPARWMVEQGVRCDGLLTGEVDVGAAALHVDGVCVPVDRAAQVLGALTRRWRDALDVCEVTFHEGHATGAVLHRTTGGELAAAVRGGALPAAALPRVPGAASVAYTWEGAAGADGLPGPA